MAIQSGSFVRGSSSLTSNLAANIALKGVRSGTMDFQKVSERLATGQRINHASDDPSGFVVIEKMRAQIAGNDAAIRNNLVTTNSLAIAQDGMSAIMDRLNKLKAVALRSIGSGAATDDKTIFQDEAEQLLENIDQIVQNTNVAGNKLLDGSGDFRIEETEGAFDQVRVKRARFPANGEVSLDVGISRLAERASIITNIDLGAANDLAQNYGADTIAVSGNLGSKQIRISEATDSKQLVEMINGSREVTGVYASSHIVNGAESVVNFADLDTDLELTAGNQISFDVSVGGSSRNVLLTATADRDNDGLVEISADDLTRALNDADLGQFSVIGGIDTSVAPVQQNFVIRHAGANDFVIQNFANAGGTMNGGSALNGLTITGTEPTAARMYTDGANFNGAAQFDVQVVSGGTSTLVTKNVAGSTLADMQAAMNNIATVTSLGVGNNGREIFQMVASASVDAFNFHESLPGGNDAANLGLLSDSGGGDGLASTGMAVLGLYSSEFGSDQQISLRNSGDTQLRFSALNEASSATSGLPQGGGALRSMGVDMVADVNGTRHLGRGFHLNYSSTTLDVELDFSPRFGVGSATNALNMALNLNYSDPSMESLLGTRPISNQYNGKIFGLSGANDPESVRLRADGLIDEVSFTVFDYYEGSRARSGLGAQLTGDQGGREHLGIRSFDTSVLGGLPSHEGDGDAVSSRSAAEGTLSQIKRGGMYALDGSPDAAYKAIDIIDRAMKQVLHSQQYIGAFQTQTVDRTADWLQSHTQNLNTMRQDISGIDFAREVINMTGAQNMVNAATSVMSQANSIPQNLLTLLR